MTSDEQWILINNDTHKRKHVKVILKMTRIDWNVSRQLTLSLFKNWLGISTGFTRRPLNWEEECPLHHIVVGISVFVHSSKMFDPKLCLTRESHAFMRYITEVAQSFLTLGWKGYISARPTQKQHVTRLCWKCEFQVCMSVLIKIVRSSSTFLFSVDYH